MTKILTVNIVIIKIVKLKILVKITRQTKFKIGTRNVRGLRQGVRTVGRVCKSKTKRNRDGCHGKGS